MAHQRRPEVRDADLQGFKYFRRLQPLFERLHPCGTARDQAGNRQLFFDHYAALVLLYFFNPVVTSLRALQQATALDKVQKRLGVRRISLGALSEATGVFDAEPLRDIVQELAGRALPLHQGREAEALRGLTAVDGSLLPALPRMVWALWMDERHRAAKLHLQFDILKAVPCDATITAGASSEPAQLQAMLHAGRLYVLDRGYASYELFRDVLRAGSSLVARIKDTAALGVTAEQTLTAEARAAGGGPGYAVAPAGYALRCRQLASSPASGRGPAHQGRWYGGGTVAADRPGRSAGGTDRLGLPLSLDD
jgi:Transposase DDE domain